MVHELRAPLTAMNFRQFFHLSQLTNDRLESSVRLLYESSSNAKAVNDLLDVAKSRLVSLRWLSLLIYEGNRRSC